MTPKNTPASAALLALMLSSSAYSADYIWTKNSVATQTWTTTGNWFGGSAFTGPGGTTDTLSFFSDTTTPLINGTNAITGSVPSLTFNTLTLNGLGATATAAAAVTIGTTGGTSWTLDGTSPTVNLNGLNNTQALNYAVAQKLVLNGTTTFAGNGTAGFSFSGIISGGNGLIKTGTSTVSLAGANTFTGSTTVNGGIVSLSGSAAKISSSNLNVGAGATFRIDNALNGSATDRLSNSLALGLDGGTFFYTSGNIATNATETIGAITTGSGKNIITVSPTTVGGTSGGTGNATLTAASLGHSSGNATVLVNGLNLGRDSTSASTGRFILTTTPSLVGTTDALSTGINSSAKDTKIVPYLLGVVTATTGGVGTAGGTANTFVTYNAGTGLRPLNVTDEFVLNSLTSGANVRTNNDTLAATSVSINSLLMANAGTGVTIAANQILNVASGAILWTAGTTGANITGASLNNGAKLDFGSQEAMLTVNDTFNGRIGAIVTGSNGLTKSGGGTLTLSGANLYTGSTTVAAGTLVLGNAQALQNSVLNTASTGTVTLSGVTTPIIGGLTGSTNLATIISSGYGSVTGVTLNPTSGSTTYSGVIADGATGTTLAKTGAGTQVLSGANSYTGQTTVTAGTLSLGASQRISDSSNLLVNGGTFNLNGFDETVGTVTISSGSINGTANTLTGSAYSLQGGTVNALLGGSGAVAVSGGTTTLGSAGRLGTGKALTISGGQLTLGGAESVVSYQQTAGTLAGAFTLTSSTAYDIQAGAVSANLGGSGVALNKTTSGTATLSGTNTYTGATNVNNGTLVLTGTGSINNTSGVTVNGGVFKNNSSVPFTQTLNFVSGTLGGTNLTGISVSVGTGQTLSPGNSPGVLGAGATTFATGGTFVFELNDALGASGTNWDRLDATSLNVTAADGTFVVKVVSLLALDNTVGNASNFDDSTNYNFLFVDAASAITSFSGTVLAVDATAFNPSIGVWSIKRGDDAGIIGGDSSQLYVSYTAIPEPSSFATLIGASTLAFVALRRRRTA